MKNPIVGHIRLWLLVFLLGCTLTPQKKYIEEAERAVKASDWTRALEFYEKTIKVSPDSKEAIDASEKASKIAAVEAREYQLQTVFLKHIIHHSKSQDQRVTAQKQLAETYFDKLNDYKNAVAELNHALQYYNTGKEGQNLRLMLARAHFFLNDFFQAKSEIEFALKENVDQEFAFKAQLLYANILFNEKKLDEAIGRYQKLMAEFPEKSKSEQVALSLAVCYEDKEEFQKAIEILEKMKTGEQSPELLDLKIKRLRERLAQAPGAKGLKK